mgnify:CR=1 FL=1
MEISGEITTEFVMLFVLQITLSSVDILNWVDSPKKIMVSVAHRESAIG